MTPVQMPSQGRWVVFLENSGTIRNQTSKKKYIQFYYAMDSEDFIRYR